MYIHMKLTVINSKYYVCYLKYRGENTSEFQPLPNIILMADLVYYEEVSISCNNYISRLHLVYLQVLQKLVDTVFSLSTPETLVYMSYEIRVTGNKPKLEATFFKVCRYLFKLIYTLSLF